MLKWTFLHKTHCRITIGQTTLWHTEPTWGWRVRTSTNQRRGTIINVYINDSSVVRQERVLQAEWRERGSTSDERFQDGPIRLGQVVGLHHCSTVDNPDNDTSGRPLYGTPERFLGSSSPDPVDGPTTSCLREKYVSGGKLRGPFLHPELVYQ